MVATRKDTTPPRKSVPLPVSNSAVLLALESELNKADTSLTAAWRIMKDNQMYECAKEAADAILDIRESSRIVRMEIDYNAKMKESGIA